MRRRDSHTELVELLAWRGPALLGTATLLAGSRPAGEDLLQAALERVLGRWSSVGDSPEIYLRRTLYRLAVDQWRARRRRPPVAGQTVVDLLADRAAGPDQVEQLDLRLSLLAGLAELPPRQRAVLVLRYFEQCDEAETAAVLGCSVGTVKSSASRGLARLRRSTALADLEPLRKGASR